MDKCFHCGCNNVSWVQDYSYEDFEIDGEGIVHVLGCSNCNSEIMYFVPLDSGEIE